MAELEQADILVRVGLFRNVIWLLLCLNRMITRRLSRQGLTVIPLINRRLGNAYHHRPVPCERNISMQCCPARLCSFDISQQYRPTLDDPAHYRGQVIVDTIIVAHAGQPKHQSINLWGATDQLSVQPFTFFDRLARIGRISHRFEGLLRHCVK